MSFASAIFSASGGNSGRLLKSNGSPFFLHKGEGLCLSVFECLGTDSLHTIPNSPEVRKF